MRCTRLQWALVLLLAGCQATGANLASNVYTPDQVNTRQDAKVVKILAVMAAKVQVDNTQQKQEAQVFGALLGAVAGGVVGNNVGGRGYGGSTIGAAVGGVGGAAAGSLVPGNVLVDGVSITYEDNGATFNSVEVGQLCQFAPGDAVVVSSAQNETRIQPNATCPLPPATKS